MRIRTHLKATSAALALLATSLFAAPASADQVFLDDVIVDGSLCVGFDCVNGESFGFDTIRMKENNVRLHFDDTSTSASFPRNDWRLVANDTSNGGASYLAFEDSTAGRKVFKVEAGAPVNALVVESDGDVGIKQANPVVDLHITEGNTPTVRLEQDGSDGFAPQTWDVAGNEANFFVRDVTNGSTLPFRIFPGAPTSALTIEATTGDIGMGTTSPSAPLDIEGAGSQFVELKDTTSGTTWNYANIASEARIVTPDSAGIEFRMSTAGDVTILGSITTGGGTCGGGCDDVFDPDFELPSIEEHAELMYASRHLPNVGPTIEGEPINISDKVGRMLNELEKAHIYIDQLDGQNKELTLRLEKLEALLTSQQ